MGLPLTVYPGTYTPGAETALHAAVDVINATWEQANLKTTDFEAKVAAITDPTTGWLSTTAAPHVTAGTAPTPSVVEPTVTIPTSVDTATILADFETEYTKLRALMVGDLTKIFADYFPDDAATYTLAETWVQGAINNPNGGLPVAVQQQITADDHARVVSETNRASDALTAKFAGMRFPLPPGALASGVLQIQQRQQDLMAESSRKITILSVERMQFAIEKALSMRQLAMTATLDYIKTMASAPGTASQVVGIGYDAQSKLISAVSGFIGARTEVQKLIASVNEFNVTTALEAESKNQSADLTLIEDRLKALLTEIQAFAQMATSLFNNLHASSGTSYGVSIS